MSYDNSAIAPNMRKTRSASQKHQIYCRKNSNEQIIRQSREHAAKNSALLAIIAVASMMILISLLSTQAIAAKLTGTVYTKDLELAKFSLLSINTTPAQRIILENGTYNIDIPPGIYTLSATYHDSRYKYEDNATLKIADDGSYTYDFIVFSEIQDQQEDLPTLEDVSVVDSVQQASKWTYILIIVLTAALTVVIIFILSKNKRKNKQDNSKPLKKKRHLGSRAKKQDSLGKNIQADTNIDRNTDINYDSRTDEAQKKTRLSKDLQEIMDLLAQEGGRLTQKDLRRNIPCSEAKMSMMLTELEHKGEIERIKKGRANLIIIKR